MCLSVDHGTTFKIAEKDITVFKVGKIRGDEFSSKYRGFIYRKGNIQNKVKLEFDEYVVSEESKYIYEGYHSYAKLSDAKMFKGTVAIFTIPKGTLHIEGIFIGTKCYVSETIIFNREYKRTSPLRKLLQLLKK